MFIKREITKKLLEAAGEFPAVSILGPRQSGKTTLAQIVFPKHRYISLEDLDLCLVAQTDPKRFLAEYPTKQGIILDEIQRAPELLSYIQTIVDREKKNGFFIITGSQNFLVDEAVTQTLAGRMAVLTLLPLSLSELENSSLLPARIETLIHKGLYPKIHSEKISTQRLYSNYLRLYVERDVRQIKNVSNLSTFQKFMRLCAGRIGQVLNLTSLGNDCGINHTTAKAWISLLEASYIVFLLYPYYKNLGKRLIKAPKLYFVDTGMACVLLKIRSPEDLSDHYMRGGLVESFMISDLLKQQYNFDEQPSLYFWRDKTGNELDCIIDAPDYPITIEIKSGKTINTEFFSGINYLKKIQNFSKSPSYLIYGGTQDKFFGDTDVLSWKSAGNLFSKLIKKR
jgi:predicted AAA+ superfamily ATPase